MTQDSDGEWHEDILDMLSIRYELLSTLAREECERPELVERLASSRATVYRGIRALEDAGMVSQGPDGYRLTTWGRVVLTAYDDFVAMLERTRAAKAFLNNLPGTPAIPPAVFRDAEVVTAMGPDPHAPGSRLSDLILDADRVRGLVKAHTQANAVDVWYRSTVEQGTDTEFVCEASFYEYLRGADSDEIAAILASEHLDAYTVSTVPFGLFLFKSGEDCLAALVAYNEADLLQGLVITTDPTALAWSDEYYRDYKQRASPVANRSE